MIRHKLYLMLDCFIVGSYFLQSHSPSSDSLDLLTVYLVISLLFVVSTMLELTFIVFLKRSSEWNENPIKPTFTGNGISTNNCRYYKITRFDYVDLISCSIYFILFLIFNCIYWGLYLWKYYSAIFYSHIYLE